MSGLPSQCERMREDLYRISMEEPVDLAVQEDDLFRRNRRLILFDMDSTLIQCEVIDELAKVAGVGEQVAAITESAMRGEIGFRESFHQRIALLKGMPETVLNGIADNLPITEGGTPSAPSRCRPSLAHMGLGLACDACVTCLG